MASGRISAPSSHVGESVTGVDTEGYSRLEPGSLETKYLRWERFCRYLVKEKSSNAALR